MTGPTVVETPTLGHWARAWDELVAALPLPSPFLRTWWLDGVGTGADHYVLVVEGETLVGGLALSRRRILGVDWFRELGHGTLCPDHLDLVAAPGRADDVMGAVRAWFTAPGSRVLDLVGLHEQARIIDAVGSAGRVSTIDVAPFEPLSADPDQYLAARSKSARQRYRKYRRRTEERGVTYRLLGDHEIAAAMEDFVALHSARDDRARLTRALPQLMAAVEGGIAAGELRVHVAEAGGRRGAVLLLFATGERLSFYQTARDVEDPIFNHCGTVIDMQAILEACTDGLHEVDFLRGNEPYKYSFAHQERRLLSLRVAHGLGGHLWCTLIDLAEASRRALATTYRRLRP